MVLLEDQSRQLFKGSFFGLHELEDFFGTDCCTVESNIIIPFEVLLRLKENGFGMYYVPRELFGKKVTPETLCELFYSRKHAQLLYDSSDQNKWYTSDHNSFFYKETIEEGWYFILEHSPEKSYFKTYDEQDTFLKKYCNDVCKNISVQKGDESWLKNILDYKNKRIIKSTNGIYRTTFTEELYRLVSVIASGIIVDASEYVWTCTKYGDEIIRVGRYDLEGADVTKRDSSDGNSMTGVRVIFQQEEFL